MHTFTFSSLALFFANIGYAQECPTDSFEPNNTHEDASTLISGDSISAQSCLYDDDYYAIVLDENSVVSISTTSIIPTGDLDLYLLGVDGSTELAFSLGDSSNESIENFFVPEAGTYYIRTSLHSDSTSNGSGLSYELDLTISTAQECIEDPYEDNDSWNNTTDISQANGTFIENLFICPNDEDWFRFDLLEHEQITVTIDFEHEGGDIDISLKDINNNILATADTIEDKEVIVFLPPAQGTFKLQVKLFSENDAQLGNTYSLQAETEIINPCGEDDFDPNETQEAAQELDEGNHSLISCDADWFSINATEGQSIDLSLLFSHLNGDLDLSLYDQEGAFLASSATSNDNESLSYTAPYTGIYYVEVSLVSNLEQGNPYTLTYEQTEPASLPSSEPTSEPTTEPTSEPSSESSSCAHITPIDISLYGIIFGLTWVGTRRKTYTSI